MSARDYKEKNKEKYADELAYKMSKAKTLAYRNLHVAASHCINPDFRSDGEAVRAKRDATCFELFGKPYNELTLDQLKKVILNLQLESGFVDAGQLRKNDLEDATKTTIIATPEQIKAIRMYGINCALYYCNFEKIPMHDPKTKNTYYGADAKAMAKKSFEAGKQIPMNIYSYLFSEWINPNAHKFLIEGEFKKFTKDPSKFHYEYLEEPEANYLIQRFSSIYINISKKDCKPFAGSISNN